MGPETGHFDLPALIDQNRVGIKAPVNDPFEMRIAQRGGYLRCHRHAAFPIERGVLLQDIFERGTFEKFKGDKSIIPVLAHLYHGENMRLIEPMQERQGAPVDVKKLAAGAQTRREHFQESLSVPTALFSDKKSP